MELHSSFGCPSCLSGYLTLDSGIVKCQNPECLMVTSTCKSSIEQFLLNISSICEAHIIDCGGNILVNYDPSIGLFFLCSNCNNVQFFD